MADLRAQIAANEKGVAELGRMTDHFGLDVVQAYMRHVQDNAEEAVRRVIGALRDGECTYELDNGAVIKVAVRVDRAARSAEIDFTGTSPQLPDNFNAPSSVAMAAVLYVLRTLVADDIPLNSGCLKPVTVIIPRGCMLAPEYPAAVAAGNVETSQAITGALYAALGVMAEGSGTMNNVTFGNERHQYYETVASGSGAHDQLAAYRSRSAGVALPGAAGAVCDPPRQWRGGPLAGRGRGPAGDPVRRADDGDHPGRSPAGGTVWDGRRRAGGAGTALDRAGRREHDPDGRL
jgi:5-oxoprolinase (ATP-hydrolysing)